MALELCNENDEFDYPVTEGTSLRLRIVPREHQKKMVRAQTKVVWKNHEKNEETDWVAWTDQMLDYALVEWSGVRRKGTTDELPCEMPYKRLLPETLRARIIAMCVGRELPQDLGDEGAVPLGEASAMVQAVVKDIQTRAPITSE